MTKKLSPEELQNRRLRMYKDPALILRLAEEAGGGRNSLVVLVEAFTNMTIEELQELTLGGLMEFFHDKEQLKPGTPYRNKAKEMLRTHLIRLKETGQFHSLDQPAFSAYHSKRPPKSLDDRTFNRIVKAAVDGVVGPIFGAFRVLRKILAGLIVPVAAAKVEDPIDELFGNISSGPPEGWDPERARRRDKGSQYSRMGSLSSA